MSILFTAHEIKQVDKGLICRIYGPIKQRQTKKVKRFNRQFIEGILGDKHEKLLNICNEQLQTKTIRSIYHSAFSFSFFFSWLISHLIFKVKINLYRKSQISL